MDIYLVNYGPSDFYTPPKPLQSALYRNNQNGSFTDVTAKAGKPRHNPMNQVVIEVLQSLPRMRHNPFVFFGREGRPFHTGIKHSDWKKYLKTVGIKNLRWHDLRHRFASRLVMRGVDGYTVSKLMGHHSTEMTDVIRTLLQTTPRNPPTPWFRMRKTAPARLSFP